jgi:hypothetical protein
MMPLWSFLVSLGTWAQSHQHLMLALCATVVILLGAARWTWRASAPERRPRL